MDKEILFEVEMAKLEEIVDKLEKGNLTLDESFNLFKEGIEITQRLERKLNEVEGKITILINDTEESEFYKEENNV